MRRGGIHRCASNLLLLRRARPTEEVEHLPSRACFDGREQPVATEMPTIRRQCLESLPNSVSTWPRGAEHPGRAGAAMHTSPTTDRCLRIAPPARRRPAGLRVRKRDCAGSTSRLASGSALPVRLPFDTSAHRCGSDPGLGGGHVRMKRRCALSADVAASWKANLDTGPHLTVRLSKRRYEFDRWAAGRCGAHVT